MPHTMRNRLCKQFGIPPQIGALLVLLLENEFVPEHTCGDKLGQGVHLAGRVLRLRPVLRTLSIEIHCTRGVGYWLDEQAKRYIKGENYESVLGGANARHSVF